MFFIQSTTLRKSPPRALMTLFSNTSLALRSPESHRGRGPRMSNREPVLPADTVNLSLLLNPVKKIHFCNKSHWEHHAVSSHDKDLTQSTYQIHFIGLGILEPTMCSEEARNRIGDLEIWKVYLLMVGKLNPDQDVPT